MLNPGEMSIVRDKMQKPARKQGRYAQHGGNVDRSRQDAKARA
jgi:hypothetical protein